MSILLETDAKFQKYVINECIDFKLACDAYGVKLNASKSGVCFCPFHYNKNTPSAKVYESGLYCFSENRSYKVSDLFDYSIIDDTLQNAFSNVWTLIDDLNKSELLKRFEQINDGSFYYGLKKEFLPLLDYKRNKMTYNEYCSSLYEVLKNISRGDV